MMNPPWVSGLTAPMGDGIERDSARTRPKPEFRANLRILRNLLEKNASICTGMVQQQEASPNFDAENNAQRGKNKQLSRWANMKLATPNPFPVDFLCCSLL
jgi:hypothetical protein